MHGSTSQTQLFAPVWRWSLALLLVCGFGLLAAVQYPAAVADRVGQTGFVTAFDVPLAYHQHISPAKRSNSSQKDEDNPQQWGMQSVEIPQRAAAQQIYRLPAFPEFPPSLNTIVQQPLIPRAPPLA